MAQELQLASDALSPVLTAPERSRLEELEAIVERGKEVVFSVGRALFEIRDSRLYREKYDTFEDYCQSQWDFSRQRAHQLIEAASVSTVVDVQNERQARELAPLLRESGEEEVITVVRELRERWGESLTADKIKQGVSERLSLEQRVGNLTSSKTAEWYTPAKYVAAVREVLGDIDLDPASSVEANQTITAKTFYDLETDGLSRQWMGRVFMNPPYGSQGAAFVAKLLDEYRAGRVEAAIMLLNSYATGTRWFQPLWDFRLCFTDHRIHFSSPGSPTMTANINGSVFVYVGPDSTQFVRVFSQFGAVVEKVSA